MPSLCLVLVFKRECPWSNLFCLTIVCWGVERTGNFSFLFTGISMKRSRIHIWTWSDDEILDSMPETTMGWEVGGKRWVHFLCGIDVNYCSKEGQTVVNCKDGTTITLIPTWIWHSCPFHQMQSPFCHHQILAGLGTCFGQWNAIDGMCDCWAWAIFEAHSCYLLTLGPLWIEIQAGSWRMRWNGEKAPSDRHHQLPGCGRGCLRPPTPEKPCGVLQPPGWSPIRSVELLAEPRPNT